MTESGKPVPNEIIHASDIYSKQEVDDLIKDRTCVNLLRPSLKTTTKNGVTCTDNRDGTYTVNGTASGYASFTIGYVNIEKDKKYRIVGCPSGGTYEPNVGYKMFVDYDGTYAIDTGESQTFEPTNESISSTTIQVNTGTVCDNLLFKPMITNDLSATYNDFVSYNDSFVTGINSGINLDLLWTNESPTSGFGPQTLTFDVNLDTYRYICIMCRYLNTADIREVNFIKPDANYYTLHVTRSENYWRYQVRCYSNIIDFGDGLVDGTTNQNACIPVQIYGVK